MVRVDRRTVLIALGAAIAAACLLTPFCLRRTTRFYSDGGALREAVQIARPALREVLWQPSRPLGGRINRPDTDEYEPRISPDGRFLAFTRGRPGRNADLWVAERKAAAWGEPEPLRAINSPRDDMGACFSLLGPGAGKLVLFFYSDRPGGEGGYDLWASVEDGEGGWLAARNLGPQVNSPFSELNPSASSDSSLLIFASNRRTGRSPEPPRWTGTVRETLDVPDYDIFAARSLGAARVELGEAAIVEDLSLPAYTEGSLAISAHGDFVYFSSNRDGGHGGFDLYRARLEGSRLGLIENLGVQVNTAGHELDPALAASGFELYFARRPAGQETEDIFVSLSREVFLKTEAGDTYWSFAAVLAFLRRILVSMDPAILALLLSFLLCLVFALIFGRRMSRLAMLTRCFVIALLVHLVAALWMSASKVHRVLMSTLGEDEMMGSFEVAVDGSLEEEVALSIRGETADTGGDAPPAFGAGGLVSPAILAPREYAGTPRLLDLEGTDPSAAVARTSMALAVRPPPGDVPIPSAALDRDPPGPPEPSELRPEEPLTLPAVALAPRDAGKPPPRALPAPAVQSPSRVVGGRPPLEDVRPLPVSLEAGVAPESLTFQERLGVPPSPVPGALREPRETPDLRDPGQVEDSPQHELAARVALPRSLPAPERAAGRGAADLRPERSKGRPAVRVASAPVLSPAGASRETAPDLAPAEMKIAPRDAATTIERMAAGETLTLPGAAADGALSSAPAVPRALPSEAAAAAMAWSSLEVVVNPDASRLPPPGEDRQGDLSPERVEAGDDTKTAGRLVAPSRAPSRGEAERLLDLTAVLQDPLAARADAARPVPGVRPISPEVAPPRASSRHPDLPPERKIESRGVSVASTGVLTPLLADAAPAEKTPGEAESEPMPIRVREAGAQASPLLGSPADAAVAIQPPALRPSGPETGPPPTPAGARSTLEVTARRDAARSAAPWGEGEGGLAPVRAEARATDSSDRLKREPTPDLSRDAAGQSPGEEAIRPPERTTGDVAVSVAGTRALPASLDASRRAPPQPELSPARIQMAIPGALVRAAGAIAPLPAGAPPRGGEPIAAAPGRIAPEETPRARVPTEVAALPDLPREASPLQALVAASSASPPAERSPRGARTMLDLASRPDAAAAATRDGGASGALAASGAEGPEPAPAAVARSKPPSLEIQRVARSQPSSEISARGEAASIGTVSLPRRGVEPDRVSGSAAPRPEAGSPDGSATAMVAVALLVERPATPRAATTSTARPGPAAAAVASPQDGARARPVVPPGARRSEPERAMERVTDLPVASLPGRDDVPPLRAPGQTGDAPRGPGAIGPASERGQVVSLGVGARPLGWLFSPVPGSARPTPSGPRAASGPFSGPLLDPPRALPPAPESEIAPTAVAETASLLPPPGGTESRSILIGEGKLPEATRAAVRPGSRPPPGLEPPDLRPARAPLLPVPAHVEPLAATLPARQGDAAEKQPPSAPDRAGLGMARAIRSSATDVDVPALPPRSRDPGALAAPAESLVTSRRTASPSPASDRFPAIERALAMPRDVRLLPRRVDIATSTAVSPLVASPAAPESGGAPRPASRAPREEPSRSVGLALRDRDSAPRNAAEPGSLKPVQATSSFVPRIYQLRAGSRREEAVREGGGSAATERAVELGLKWLALHQSADGRWSLRDFFRHLPQVSDRDRWHADWDGRGRNDSRGGTSRAENGDTAATGLAVLAFLGHGDTQVEAGPYQENVKRGLRFLLGREQRDGDLRGGGNLYMHAIASFAICEAYALTRDPQLEEPARRAIGYAVRTQNPDLGGWRYEPYPQGKDVDTSVFGWMLMAVKSARLGGLEVESRALTRMAKYLESARMSRGGGRYAYQPGLPRSSLAMTAQGFFCQQVLAELRPPEDENERIRLRRATNESVSILLQNRPEAAEQDGANLYYWYYATLALFQEDGVAWDTWNSRMKEILLGLQLGEEHGTAAGSWDPLDRRAQLGGRVYSTAISILSLEVYYRYAPGEKK